MDTFYTYDTPFDRVFLQLSNGIRHAMPPTDRKLELQAKDIDVSTVSQAAVCSNGLRYVTTASCYLLLYFVTRGTQLFGEGFINTVGIMQFTSWYS